MEGQYAFIIRGLQHLSAYVIFGPAFRTVSFCTEARCLILSLHTNPQDATVSRTTQQRWRATLIEL